MTHVQLARTICFFLVGCVICASAGAETLRDPAAIRAFGDRVMTKVGQGDSAAGLKLARPFLVIPPAEFDVMLEQLKLQQPAITQRFGKTIGYEFIRDDKVGDHLLRLIYIQRFERHVMRWSLYFYRGDAGWILNTFKTDDDIRQLFAM